MPLSDSGATVADISASDPSQNLRLVYGVLTGLGVPPKTALGAMTSLAGESGGKLSTAAINRGDGSDGSDSIGFGQWNGPRARALKATAAQMGLPVTDIRAQAAHLADELQGPYHNVLAALQAKDDAAYGAGIWTADYERPAVNNTAARLRFLPQITKALGAGPVTGLDAIAQATGTPQAPVTRGIAPLAFAEPQKPQGETPQQTYSRIAFQQPAQAAAPSDDDLLNAFGAGAPAPAASAAQPKAPAASPANGAVSDDDLLSAFAGPPQAAEKPAAPPAPAAAIPNTSKLLDPGQAKQDLQDVATAGTAFGEGIPIIGGALRYMQAGSGAAASYLINPFLSEEEQSKGTFGERYNRLLGQRDAQMEAFKEGHPVENTALNIAGGVTALGPVAATELGGAALGVRGSGIVPRILAGGATGAVVGGADAAIRGDNPLTGAEWGGALGALAPAAGGAIGAGVNALLAKAEGIAPAASTINRLLGEIGMTPQQARQAVQKMGPNATLADIDPALTTEAGAVAAQGGGPTSVLRGFMSGRAAAADDRVSQMIDRTLGPKPDLATEEANTLSAARTAASPFYKAARASPTPMDVTPVLSDIDQSIASSANRSGQQAVLLKIKDMLTKQKVTMPGPNGQPTQMIVPESDPSVLLKVRQEIDDMIDKAPQNPDTSAGRGASKTMQDLREKIDDVLKTDPNIRAGDALYASEMKSLDALKEGTELFKSGTRLDDFKTRMATALPQEIDALRRGARIAIGDTLEAARRGALADAKSMFAKASANRAKLKLLFPNADDALDAIQAENAMRATEQRVGQNSATAERLNAGQRYRPGSSDLTGDAVSGAAGMLLGDPSGGLATALVKRGGNALLNAMSGDYYNRLTTGAARGLSATGPALDDFVQAMERAGRLQAGNSAVSQGADTGANLLLNVLANQKRIGGANKLLPRQ